MAWLTYATWVKRYKITNIQTSHSRTIENLSIHRLSCVACQTDAIREGIRLIYLLKSILISAKTMAPNEKAYTHMACWNAKRSGVIYSIRHFAFDFEVIRCNRNACGHVWIGSTIFGWVRLLSAFMVTIDVCNGNVIDFGEDMFVIKFIGKCYWKNAEMWLHIWTILFRFYVRLCHRLSSIYKHEYNNIDK